MMQFELDTKEEKVAEEFIKQHSKSCKVCNSKGMPIGPLFTYCFTPTGIDVEISILCTKCGDKKDITNYDKCDGVY